MSHSFGKFGETYLNLSHIRQITFDDFPGLEKLIAKIIWANGTQDKFSGKTARELLSFVNPEFDNGPETACKIDQNSLIEMLGVSSPTFCLWRGALGLQFKKYYSDPEKLAFLDLKARLENKEVFEEVTKAIRQELENRN